MYFIIQHKKNCGIPKSDLRRAKWAIAPPQDAKHYLFPMQRDTEIDVHLQKSWYPFNFLAVLLSAVLSHFSNVTVQFLTGHHAVHAKDDTVLLFCISLCPSVSLSFYPLPVLCLNTCTYH